MDFRPASNAIKLSTHDVDSTAPPPRGGAIKKYAVFVGGVDKNCVKTKKPLPLRENDNLRKDGAGIANMAGATVYLTNSEVSENNTRREAGSSGAGLFSVFGSPYPSIMLAPESPARDAGNNQTCPTADQRGVTPPQTGTCDLGAVEYIPLPVSIEQNDTITATMSTLYYDCFNIWHSSSPYTDYILNDTIYTNTTTLTSGYYQFVGHNNNQMGEVNIQ